MHAESVQLDRRWTFVKARVKARHNYVYHYLNGTDKDLNVTCLHENHVLALCKKNFIPWDAYIQENYLRHLPAHLNPPSDEIDASRIENIGVGASSSPSRSSRVASNFPSNSVNVSVSAVYSQTRSPREMILCHLQQPAWLCSEEACSSAVPLAPLLAGTEKPTFEREGLLKKAALAELAIANWELKFK